MSTAQDLVKKSEETLARMLYEQTMLLKAEVEGTDQEPDRDEGGEATAEVPSEGTTESDGEGEAPEGMEGIDADSMPTVEELVAEFQQMSPEHLDLFKQAIAQVQGTPSGAATAPTETPEMGKSEAALKLQAAKELRLAAETLQKSQAVSSAKPLRVTPRVAPKPASKTLSKSEVHDRLLTLSKSASTSGSDRAAINQYYTKGDLSAVKHLLG